jgi:hypothetical protein
MIRAEYVVLVSHRLESKYEKTSNIKEAKVQNQKKNV